MKILFAGGGTGGHIFPIIALVQSLKKLTRNKLDLLWINAGQKIEKETACKYHLCSRAILCGKLRRYFSFYTGLDFFKLILGFFQSFWIILKFKPDLIFVKGGFVSLPVVLAGILLKERIYAHESDRLLGLVNKFFLPFFEKVFLAFPLQNKKHYQKYANKLILIGHPVRDEFFLMSQPSRLQIYHFFGLNPELKTILVLGGSQGAAGINDFILKILSQLLKKYNLLHLTGDKNQSEKQNFNQTKKQAGIYQRYKFLEAEKLNRAYNLADLVIARAGSGVLAEISLKALPAILIPYPYSSCRHQLANAQFLQEQKAAIVLEEVSLTPPKLLENIQSVLEDERLLKRLSKNIKKFSYPKASIKIAQILLSSLS